MNEKDRFYIPVVIVNATIVLSCLYVLFTTAVSELLMVLLVVTACLFMDALADTIRRMG